MKKSHNRGITLVALVITVVVLLILASISISAVVGNNGIIKQAIKAKELTRVSSEKEAIEMVVFLANMNNILDFSNKYFIGTPLNSGIEWNVIIINDSKKTYGTNWNYITKNTYIPNYGNTEYEYLVNYNTGDIIQLQTDNYINLSYSSSLAVTDGLVFNADPTNMSNTESWKSSVILNGFNDDNETGGINESSINFDGINDWIQINGNLNIENEISIEIYGKIYSTDSNSNFVPIFAANNGRNEYSGGLCMRMFLLGKDFVSNFGYASCGNSDIWENEKAKQNIHINTDFMINNQVMYTITYRHIDNTYSLYQDGILKQKAILDNNYWENFKNNEIPNINFFQIGKVTWNGSTKYLNGEIHSIRIYNKTLNDFEVLENYNKTVNYYNIISNK